jgi:MATE family multidrug resistance protein
MHSSVSLRLHLYRTVVLALPVTVARAGLVLMLSVDSMLAGRAGGNELAYMGISMAPQLIMLTTGVGLLVGTLVLAAQARGAGRLDECGRIWRLALLFAGALGLAFAILQWHGDFLLRLFGEDEQIARGGGEVLRMWALGTPGFMLYMATSSFMEGISRPRAAMFIVIAANLINYGLGHALVFGHFGLPTMDAAGAALATSVTLWAMFLALSIYALFMRDAVQLGVWAPLAGHFRLVGRMLLLGLPVALSVVFETGAFSGAAVMAGWLGATQLAAYQLSNNVISFLYMISLGLATAAAVRVGNASGSGDRSSLATAGWIAVCLAFLVMLAIGLAIALFRLDVVALYTADPDVAAAAVPALGLLCYLVIFDSTQAVLMGALRGAGDVLVPTATYAVAFGGCAIPLCYYFGYRRNGSTTGLVASLIVGLVVAALLLALRFVVIARRRPVALPA